MPAVDFINLVRRGSPGEPVPRWIRLLTREDKPLTYNLNRLMRLRAAPEEVEERSLLYTLRDLLLTRVIVWLFFVPDERRERALGLLRAGWISITRSYLCWSWSRAARTVNCLLELPARDSIFVFHPCAGILDDLLKRRVRAQEARPWPRPRDEPLALSVPAPSLRVDGSFFTTRGTDQVPFSRRVVMGAVSEADHEKSLGVALARVADSVPCGNPINAMVSSLCYECGLLSACAVLPLGLESSTGLAYEVATRILATNVLNSSVSLPLISSAVVAAVAQKRATVRAILCRDCGHCLNFGRGKFKTVNFRPTSIFYCRDRKEKQFTVCATTGRIYCNFCGSQSFRKLSLAGRDTRGDLFLRAILANNAASCLGDKEDQRVSVVVPCLVTASCTGSCVRETLSIGDLLYLTQSLENFCCSRCRE